MATKTTWVGCDDCGKWRRVDADSLPEDENAQW